MRKHETAVCGTARTVVWEVGKCENRRQMPFMISIYLLPDFFPRIFFFSAGFFFSLNISLSRRFCRWRRFFLIDYFSHRFHEFTQIFSGYILFSVISLFRSFFNLSVWKDNADFSNSLFFLVGNYWILHIINPTFSRYLKFYRFRFISLLFYHFPHVSIR